MVALTQTDSSCSLAFFSRILYEGKFYLNDPRLDLLENTVYFPPWIRDETHQPPTASSGSYRALVNVYLGGGADSFNLLTPYGDECPLWNQYQTIRGDIALTAEQLLEITTSGQACSRFSVHAYLHFVRDLYNNGEAVFDPNVGSLVEPITRSQYKGGGAKKCVGLFSHSDQVEAAQTLVCQVPGASPKGAGGRLCYVEL